MKTIKIIIQLFLIICIISICFSTKIYAIDEIFSDGDSFLDASYSNGKIKEDTLKETNSKVYNMLLVIGIVVAVIIGAILGIKFILGSVGEKAKIQEQLVPYIIGCFVVFGAFGIWKVGINIGNHFFGGYNSIEEIDEASNGIIDGTLDITSLTDEKIKQLYGRNFISSDLNTRVNGDSRGRTRSKTFNIRRSNRGYR